jgi:hypothetical protein
MNIRPSVAFKSGADWLSAEVRAYMKDQVATHLDTVADLRDNDLELTRFVYIRSKGALYRLNLNSGAADDGDTFIQDNVGRRYEKSLAAFSTVVWDAAVDDLSARDAFDGEDAGFVILVADVGDGRAAYYVMGSGGSGDWSDAFYLTGPEGAQGDITPELEELRDEAEDARDEARDARDAALAAAEASGAAAFFDTYADADAALPGLSEGDIIEVIADEEEGGANTRYRVESGVLVLKQVFGSARFAALIDDDTFATASSSNINSAEATKAYADTKVAIVADRTALKLVDTTAITIAVVKDGARSGVYLWDGTVPIATHQKWTGASFTERQYVAPNASADGAWVLLSGLNSGADSHQFYGNRLDLTESNDATAITPALFLRKNSSAGVNGMGLAKIQWRGTDDAGNRDIDAGRFDAVMTNADEDDFTARMSVSPHVKGNDENIAVMSWDDGVLVSAGSSIHALTSISGGSGYAVGDRIALVSALAGQLGVAEVVTAPAGVIASVLFRNRGYGYANAETVTFSAITGTGTGGSATVVRGRSTFPQGFGTVNAARGYYIGDSPVLLLSPDASFVTAAFEYLTLRDGVNALFNYGNGIANLATALYIRNLDTLRVSSGGTQVNRSRIIGKRVITYTSDTTLGALYNVVFVNATSGNVTLTLPAANAWGANMSPDILIRRIDGSGNTVTIQRGGSDTLNGGTSETIAAGIARRYNTNGATAWYSNGLAA